MQNDVVNNKKLRPIEMLGDNLDITIIPSKMSVQNQKKSLHWFLILVKQKQITFDESKAPFDPPVDFPALSTVNWIALSEQFNSLMSNFKFHIANMQNTPSEYESLLRIIHRPEGLHREMNFLLVYFKIS